MWILIRRASTLKCKNNTQRSSLCCIWDEVEIKSVSYLISSVYFRPSSTLIVVLMLFNFASPAQKKWYYGKKNFFLKQFFSVKLTSYFCIEHYNLPVIFYCAGEISLKIKVTAQGVQLISARIKTHKCIHIIYIYT